MSQLNLRSMAGDTVKIVDQELAVYRKAITRGDFLMEHVTPITDALLDLRVAATLVSIEPKKKTKVST